MYFRKRLFPTKRLPGVHGDKSIMHNQPRIKSRLSRKKRDDTYVDIADGNIYYSVSNVRKYFFSFNIDLFAAFFRSFLSSIHSFMIVNTNFLLFRCFALCDFYF